MIPAFMDEAPPPADVRVPYGDHPSQFVDFRNLGKPWLAVLIHGGFWRNRRDLTYFGHLAIALGESGYTTANIEYRRVGEEGGGWPGTFDDVKRAIQFAREYARPEETVALGHSAGGHLALWAAAEIPDLACAVGLAPVANLRRCWELHLSNDAVVELLGGTPDEVPDRYAFADPVQRPTDVPRLIIHGTADDIVPIEISRGFPLVEVPGGDHFQVAAVESKELILFHVIRFQTRRGSC